MVAPVTTMIALGGIAQRERVGKYKEVNDSSGFAAYCLTAT